MINKIHLPKVKREQFFKREQLFLFLTFYTYIRVQFYIHVYFGKHVVPNAKQDRYTYVLLDLIGFYNCAE